MSKPAETSHAKNVANLETLIKYLSTLDNYKPTRAQAKIPALQLLHQSSDAQVIAISQLQTEYNNAVNAQIMAFKPLSKMVTRIINAFKSVVENKIQAERAISLGKLINTSGSGGSRGRGTKKDTGTPIPSETEDTKDSGAKNPETVRNLNPSDDNNNHISTSHRSYDNRVANFGKLIDVLVASNFAPNEEDLQTDTLAPLQASLKAITEAVDTPGHVLLNARIARNKSMYAPETGIPDSVNYVKIYMKSVFDSNSPEVKYVEKLKFRDLPK